MSEFLVTRLITEDSLILPCSKGFGNVEIRRGKLDLPCETRCLQASAKAFKEDINCDLSQRISTVVDTEDVIEADDIAESRFEQVLDCLELRTYGFGKAALRNAGLVRDLIGNTIGPRMPFNSSSSFPVFAINDQVIPIVDDIQAILLLSDSELKLAILRSLHWLRQSRLELRLHHRFLFAWFAIETLTKEHNEDVTGKVIQVLGFPIGRIGQFLSPACISSLQNHVYYEYSKRWLETNLEQIRQFRNNTVHSGFRQWEVNQDLMEDYTAIVTWTVPRLLHYAMKAAFQGGTTIQQLWQQFPNIYEVDVNQLHHTIIYFITNRKTLSGKHRVSIQLTDLMALQH